MLSIGWTLDQILDLTERQVAFVSDSIIYFTKLKMGITDRGKKTIDIAKNKEIAMLMGLV